MDNLNLNTQNLYLYQVQVKFV